MQKIASFSINHDILTTGIYTSRIDFGDIATYDIRFYAPNKGCYLTYGAAHTIEHIFATWIRSGEFGDKVVYVGPMGCLTGFYVLLKGVDPADAIKLIVEGMAFVRDYEGEIPGAKRPECGNYLLHDLVAAKYETAKYCEAVKDWTVDQLVYPE